MTCAEMVLGASTSCSRDLPVGEAGRDELGDLEFACAQRVPRLALLGTVELRR